MIYGKYYICHYRWLCYRHLVWHNHYGFNDCRRPQQIRLKGDVTVTEESQDLLRREYSHIRQWIFALWNTQFNKIFTPLNIDVEEFAAQSMLEICENIDKFDPAKSKLITFVVMVVRNKMKSYVTFLNREVRRLNIYSESLNKPLVGGETELIDTIQDISIDICTSIEDEQIMETITVLPDFQQSIVKDLVRGLSVEDIAIYHNITEDKIKSEIKLIQDNIQFRTALFLYLKER